MPGIRAKLLQIKANVYRNHGQCFCKFWAKDKEQYVSNMCLEIKIKVSVVTDRFLKQGQCSWNQGQDT